MLDVAELEGPRRHHRFRNDGEPTCTLSGAPILTCSKVSFSEPSELSRKVLIESLPPVAFESNRFGMLAGYFEGVNDQICEMVQNEGRKGVAAVAEIAAVDGVDGLFIGPSDLAAGLAYLDNANHPEVGKAMVQVYAAGKGAGEPIGILAPAQTDARRYMAMGAIFVAVGSDLGVFRAGTQALRDRFLGGEV